MEVTLRFEASDPSRVGEARRAAAHLARDLGFGAEDTERVSLVVTELATNLVKHARDGELLVVRRRREAVPAVDILSIDRGPGTDDATEWLRDGYSTSGSPGTGLGAVRRLADVMDIYSRAGQGTGVVARVAQRPRASEPRTRPAFETGGLSVPIRGEQVCGDGWGVRVGESGAAVIMADGLGHGPDAAAAAAAALRVFYESNGRPPAEILAQMAASLRDTRGAAVAVATLVPALEIVQFAGIGNIAAAVHGDGTSRSLVSSNGTVGHESGRIRESAYPYPPGSVLILHSDGLKTRWKLEEYPGLYRRDPALIAAILYRDQARGTDDVGIVAVREGPGSRRRQACGGVDR